jgi:ATP-dependent protease HslVU (ClpYQ) peptidase subunit
MTCIIGLETKDGVIVAADSQATSGHEHGAVRAECAKVIRKSNHLIACAGVARLSDVMRYHLTLPRYDGGSVHRHAVTVIVPAIRKALTEHLPERDKDTAMRMIIGVGGSVFEVDACLHVQLIDRGYVTAGSGGEVALGALHATSALAPRVRVYLALEAACALLTDCGAPFVIKEMKK